MYHALFFSVPGKVTEVVVTCQPMGLVNQCLVRWKVSCYARLCIMCWILEICVVGIILLYNRVAPIWLLTDIPITDINLY